MTLDILSSTTLGKYWTIERVLVSHTEKDGSTFADRDIKSPKELKLAMEIKYPALPVSDWKDALTPYYKHHPDNKGRQTNEDVIEEINSNTGAFTKGIVQQVFCDHVVICNALTIAMSMSNVYLYELKAQSGQHNDDLMYIFWEGLIHTSLMCVSLVTFSPSPVPRDKSMWLQRRLAWFFATGSPNPAQRTNTPIEINDPDILQWNEFVYRGENSNDANVLVIRNNKFTFEVYHSHKIERCFYWAYKLWTNMLGLKIPGPLPGWNSLYDFHHNIGQIFPTPIPARELDQPNMSSESQTPPSIEDLKISTPNTYQLHTQV
jgi:hypothetical protein